MGTTDWSTLNAQYGVPGTVVFKEGPGGLAMVEVANARVTATIALQGAHLMTWTPRAEKSVIWLAAATNLVSGKPIRGGIPVCWPWFGPHATSSAFPNHGFARTAPWEVIAMQTLADGAIRFAFRLIQTDATLAQWPPAARVELHMTVGGELELDLVTYNTGPEPIKIGEALHTYFKVSDIRRVLILGLDGCPYLDKLDGGQRKQQSGPVRFGAETDRIYLDSIEDCLIEDPAWSRRIRIAKQGSRSTVVWNPWAEKAAKMGDFGDNGYHRMVCLESANAADDIVTILPGDEHHLWVRYSVEPLSY